MSKHQKFEDISSDNRPGGFENSIKFFFGKIKVFFLRNRKRNLKALLSILICLVLVVAAMGGAYLRKMLTLINFDPGNSGDPDATFATEETSEEDISFETMYDVAGADSVKDLLKTWATNGGEKLHSKNVINVLLIGEDNDDGSHRSDSMILASVNTKTKKITLCSFLRDSYSYMEINGGERYDKTNHAYSWAGPSKVLEVLSDNYKIEIDHYVSINFESFVKVIDTLGGVSVPITESEARFMNRTTAVKGFEAGENVLLNGKRALIYSRIRKLDSENERTRRQRNVISSIIKNVKASSISDLNKAIETFLPYVTTNYKTNEILSLGTQALSEGWLTYDIVSMVEPSEDVSWGVDRFRTYTGYLFVWIVDYIRAARDVQLALYDRTNIQINPETHISAIDMVRGSRSDYSDDYNTGYNTGTDAEESDEYESSSRVYEEETSSTRKSIFRWTTRNSDESGESEHTTRDILGELSQRFERTTDSTEESTDYLTSESYYESESYTDTEQTEYNGFSEE